MSREKLYYWWKQKPSRLRQPLVFILGVLLILLAPFVGAIPGPGGMIVFLAGIAILATEFDWAENLKVFFLTRVPAELKKRWQPTPRWAVVFDVTAGLLLAAAFYAWHIEWFALMASPGIAALCLFLFNRNRLSWLKAQLKKRRKT